ncbi:hypothetical protein E3N88_34310 [Mikania micrantha]|uniref:Uncharacterized protein n=1 Tax=Mikania micrantha TaxID=192012 RepID=A0A5N6LXS5_9ASTR|nr:hypothetical protein E3N88_34310 [Mikania micrantha]
MSYEFTLYELQLIQAFHKLLDSCIRLWSILHIIRGVRIDVGRQPSLIKLKDHIKLPIPLLQTTVISSARHMTTAQQPPITRGSTHKLTATTITSRSRILFTNAMVWAWPWESWTGRSNGSSP